MKYIILILISLGIVMLSAQSTTLPTCYYTYDQITDLLFQYEAQYPGQAKVHLLGYSQEDQVPIYGMKLSNNVLSDDDEPALLFVGQVHAEEVLGVQIVMNNIEEILENRLSVPYSQWLAQLEMWFIPTLTPEGHNVVTANLDTSYRKNKRDNNSNGIFDYSPLVGYDVDGVDINRNFAFNWVHGDTLMQPGGLEWYDYYRGPFEMSESEVQAVYDLCEQKKFIFSIVWHSSRTGNLSEKAYYSFNWKGVRQSPDMTLAQSIAQGIAGQIIKESGVGTYEALPNLSRKGCFHDWIYQQYGTIQILIECGTSNLQPDSLLMVNTVQRCSNGVRWLLNRALPISTSVPSSSLLTGTIKDADTLEPLEAELIVQERHAPWFRARKSKPTSGRYYRPIAAGEGAVTLSVRKKGYHDYALSNVSINNASWTQRNILMQKKDEAVFSGLVSSGGQAIPARIILYGYEPDTLFVNGNFVHNTFEGEDIRIEITADGYYPYIGVLSINPGVNTHHFNLSAAETLFSENWESGIGNWVLEGPWVIQNELSASGSAITDSWGGSDKYAMNCDWHISTGSPVSIPTGNNVYLIFDNHLYTEWSYDLALVQVSEDNESWTTLWQKSGRHDYWHSEYVSLDEYRGHSIYLRFRLTDQSIHAELTDPGWTIDNIKIVRGTAVPNEDQINLAPMVTALYPNYPNPFNPETSISYSISKPTRMSLNVYNIKGQLVKQLKDGMESPGNHKLVWNGRDESGRPVSSGIYYYRFVTEDYSQTMKMVLLK